MNRYYAIVMLVALATGCAHLPQPREYFPEQAFDDFTANWYGKHLRAMREPSLQPQPRVDATLGQRHAGNGKVSKLASTCRFLYLPTFSEPIIFRLEVDGEGKAVLITKRTNGKGGYGEGRLTYSVTSPVPSPQLDHIMKLIKELGPDSMPAAVPEMRGLDGSEWILEVADGETYHVLSRWCARQTGSTEIGRIDGKGNQSTVTLRDTIRKISPAFDVDAYFAGTKRLTELVDFMLTLSPLKNEKELEIY